MEYGLFSPSHIPGNLYYFLLAGPDIVYQDGISRVLKFPYIASNPWGMSIFIISPYLVYLFFLKYKDRLSKILWLNSLVIAIPILLFYGIGFRQFGYRYSLDFLPLLFLILMIGVKKKYREMPEGFKTTILVTAFTNLYLYLSF